MVGVGGSLLQAVFRQGNDAEENNEASEELEREALMQCFVRWVSGTYQPAWLYVRVCAVYNQMAAGDQSPCQPAWRPRHC